MQARNLFNVVLKLTSFREFSTLSKMTKSAVSQLSYRYKSDNSRQQRPRALNASTKFAALVVRHQTSLAL